MSLKELFDAGMVQLRYGGRIVHAKEGDQDYYDLIGDDGRTVFCDGEDATFEEVATPEGTAYAALAENGGRIMLSKEEYKTAVFS